MERNTTQEAAEADGLPTPETVDLPRQIRAAAKALGHLFERYADEALKRLQAAEAKGLERLEEYVPQDRLMTMRKLRLTSDSGRVRLSHGRGREAFRSCPIS